MAGLVRYHYFVWTHVSVHVTFLKLLIKAFLHVSYIIYLRKVDRTYSYITLLFTKLLVYS